MKSPSAGELKAGALLHGAEGKRSRSKAGGHTSRAAWVFWQTKFNRLQILSTNRGKFKMQKFQIHIQTFFRVQVVRITVSAITAISPGISLHEKRGNMDR